MHPPLSARVAGLHGSVYSNLAAMLGAHEGETFPLHVGDTWLAPPEGCRPDDVSLADWPEANRYTEVPGLPALREAIRAHVAGCTGVPVAAGEVLVSAGGTGTLAAVVGALVEPGADVLVLSPAWPLFAGMVPAFGGRAIAVPFIGEVSDGEGAAELLDRYVTPATVAIYLNTPNNPTGRVIPRGVLEGVAAWARRRGIWVVSDEVYDQLQYVGEHTYMRALAPERTLSVWSFSKAFGMAGYRCGFVVGPAGPVGAATRLATYLAYCAPHPAQLLGLRALGPAGQAWVANTRARYAEVGKAAAARLGVPAPEGSTFLFVDVSAHLDDAGLPGFLERCVRRGLLAAPGTVFGPYPGHVRVCFTAVAPDRTLRGVDVLASLMGR